MGKESVLFLQDDKLIISKMASLWRKHEWAHRSLFHTISLRGNHTKARGGEDPSPLLTLESGSLTVGCFIITWRWDKQQDALYYKYKAAYLCLKSSVFFFLWFWGSGGSSLWFLISCFSALEIVRAVSQRKASAQLGKAAVQCFHTLPSLWQVFDELTARKVGQLGM